MHFIENFTAYQLTGEEYR